MQHLAAILFAQMGNITLVSRDAYLGHLGPGIKPDPWCVLRNSPLNSSGLYLDDMVHRAEDEIAKAKAECHTTQPAMAGTPLGCRISIRNIWTVSRRLTSGRSTSASQEVLTWHSFGKSNSNNMRKMKGTGLGGCNPKSFKENQHK